MNDYRLKISTRRVREAKSMRRRGGTAPLAVTLQLAVFVFGCNLHTASGIAPARPM